MRGRPFTSDTAHTSGPAISQQMLAFRLAKRAEALLPSFLDALKDGQWHRGRDLSKRLQINERALRQCADDSEGQVISSNKGYRLLACATNREINRAEARLISQGRKMIARAAQYRRARNQGGFGA